MTIDEVDDFTRQYIETLVWSSEPDDESWQGAMVSSELIERAWHECKAFLYRTNWMLENEENQYHSDAAHDFALTRNHHGAGFWDGDWPKHGNRLTNIAESFGEITPYMGDDGLIYAD